ncbi:hypothetical protein ACWOET_05980 [Enterococcus caccae]
MRQSWGIVITPAPELAKPPLNIDISAFNDEFQLIIKGDYILCYN